jgi:hypothetical protein
MTTIDLAGEFAAATVAAQRADFDHLEGQGVPHDYLWLGPMRFGITNIATIGNSYEPMPDGKRAFVVPAFRSAMMSSTTMSPILWPGSPRIRRNGGAGSAPSPSSTAMPSSEPHGSANRCG